MRHFIHQNRQQFLQKIHKLFIFFAGNKYFTYSSKGFNTIFPILILWIFDNFVNNFHRFYEVFYHDYMCFFHIFFMHFIRTFVKYPSFGDVLHKLAIAIKKMYLNLLIRCELLIHFFGEKLVYLEETVENIYNCEKSFCEIGIERIVRIMKI